MLSTTDRTWFTAFAQWASRITGRPVAFIAAVAVLLLWCVTGPVFGFSDTGQLVINTGHDDRHLPDGVRDSEHAEP